MIFIVWHLCEEEPSESSTTQCVLLHELISQSVEIAVAMEQPLLEESKHILYTDHNFHYLLRSRESRTRGGSVV